MTTIMTTMDWVVNPSVGINNSADALVSASHLNAYSFLAITTHTLATFIIFIAIYMLHCIQIYTILIVHPLIYTLVQGAFPTLALLSKARVVFDLSAQVIPPRTCPKKSSS